MKQEIKGRAGASTTNIKETTVKCKRNCCLPSWCTREAAKLFGSAIFMAGILCKYCNNDQGRLMACAVCVAPTGAPGSEPCLPSQAAGAWAAELWWAFSDRWIVLPIRKTHTFYVQTLFFPTRHRKGFKHVIPAPWKTLSSVFGICCFTASLVMHQLVKRWYEIDTEILFEFIYFEKV